MTHTVESLLAFRDRVERAFLDKQIRSPVHFPSDQQAGPCLRFFERFRPRVDWFCGNWRSMWHVLLAGVPGDELFQMILNGRSMFLQSRQHRIICSSIVGGVLPIAAGLAVSIKRRGGDERVYVCAGDMTATTGLYSEFKRYCECNALPVNVLIEDNGTSTDSDTRAAWGGEYRTELDETRYHFKRNRPHVGLERFVSF